MDEKIIYLVVLIGAGILLALALLSFMAPPASAGWNDALVQVPSECGDINDPQNLQHLSHHPDKFQACYKVVDPAKFKSATGQDISAFIR